MEEKKCLRRGSSQSCLCCEGYIPVNDLDLRDAAFEWITLDRDTVGPEKHRAWKICAAVWKEKAEYTQRGPGQRPSQKKFRSELRLVDIPYDTTSISKQGSSSCES
jgi:hypothetical protein